MSSPIVPKVSQRLVVRTLVLMFVLAIVLGVYQWAQQQKGDFDLAPSDTAGMIAAIEYKDEGQQVVAFKPDGTKIENSGWEAGVIDRDLVWQPDGNRLFFVSDRAKVPGSNVKAFNIVRWDAARASAPSQRTVGTRGRSNPNFADQPGDEENRTALIASGGFVLEFDSKDRATRQVLPPLGNEVSVSEEEGAGSSGQFGGLYGQLGSSFRLAKWAGGKRYIAAIMRSEEGEVLVIQDTELTDKGQISPPRPVMAGEKIEISIDPKSGKVVFSVTNFRWLSPDQIPPQFKQGNKITIPFKHAICIATPGEPSFEVIAASNDDTACFGAPAVSPSGDRVALTVGSYADGNLSPREMTLMPVSSGGVRAAAKLVDGEVFEPSWHPNGQSLAFIRRKDSNRTVFAINVDGSGERQVSGDGEFAFPRFSPQSK